MDEQSPDEGIACQSLHSVMGHLLVSSQWILAFPLVRLCRLSHSLEIRVAQEARLPYSTDVPAELADGQVGGPGDQLDGGGGLPSELLIRRRTQSLSEAHCVIQLSLLQQPL